MDRKDGLVAPVWSDSGEVPVATDMAWFREWQQKTRERFAAEAVASGTYYHPEAPFVLTWSSPATETVAVARPSDPNAKPALPALTRVGGNKRGPGWRDE